VVEGVHTVHWVSTSEIIGATAASVQTDLNQFEGNRYHPHAAVNRGYFFEQKNAGRILGGDWDLDPISFDQLVEYKSIISFLEGDSWAETPMAKRTIKYINRGYESRGFSNSFDYEAERPRQLQVLLESVRKFGVQEAAYFGNDFWDNISVNVGREGSYLFNNRGTHRLCIAKALGIESVPVIFIVKHASYIGKQVNF